jgi:hypothetical protein
MSGSFITVSSQVEHHAVPVPWSLRLHLLVTVAKYQVGVQLRPGVSPTDARGVFVLLAAFFLPNFRAGHVPTGDGLIIHGHRGGGLAGAGRLGLSLSGGSGVMALWLDVKADAALRDGHIFPRELHEQDANLAHMLN